jgi:hypothetical protein
MSGYVPACPSEAKYVEALSKLTTAVTRAEKAADAIRAERVSDAFYWLNLLFGGGGDFPAYYY